MKRNADMMMEMTSAYKKATEMGTPCACYINEAAQQTRKLFQFALRKKEIKLEIDVRPEISVKAPTPVITLVLAALTYNAIDAIQSRGTITIKAEAREDVVYCQVINTGLPIDDEIKPYLFRPGAKGKNEHSGRGLYFVSRSLSNYKGEIALSYSKPEETCFTFNLPALAN
jgi:signal transduction histidine kinase